MRTLLISGLVSLVLLCSPATVSAQTPRRIEVKVLDELGNPLSEAHVVVRPTVPPTTLESILEPSVGLPKPIGRATTDASGAATIEIITADVIKKDEPVAVMAWKLGYGPANVMVQNSAELRCSPVRTRTLQVLDSTGKPAAGLKVTRDVNTASEAEQFDPPWWRNAEYVTDELGLVSFETQSATFQAVSIVEKDGTLHRFAASELNSRLAGRPSDWRDLIIARLVRHGKLHGKLPAEYSQDYGVRVRKDNRNSLVRLNDRTSVFSEPHMESDGQFHFDALEEGDYNLVVYRKTPYDASKDPPLQRQPIAIHRVVIEAGKTASVQIGTESLARVSGRIVSATSSADFQGKMISLSQKVPSANDPRGGQYHPLLRTVCATDGTFVAWLPPGKFQVTPGAIAGFRAALAPEFEIGAGAASFTLDDIALTSMKTLKVNWPGKSPFANTMQGSLNSRLVFQLGDNTRIDCMLTADGFGKIDVPIDAEVTKIYQDPTTSNSTESAFTDLDESENFLLELKTSAKGVSANIGVSGKVVDANNQPMAGVPVSIMLTFEPIASSSNNSNIVSIASSVGTQAIDLVVTQQDGTFQVPPRQLLRRVTIPDHENEKECKFIFTASTHANPNPIEIRKVFQSKPSAWSESHVEFPNLVIDHPLGGNRLTGKLLDAQGQPSAGELVRLHDKRRIVRTLTDREGNFAFDDLAGPTWVLREKDWSIHAISDYSQPLALKLNAQHASGTTDQAEPESVWKRADRKDRVELAKQVLKSIANGQPAGQPIFLPDEAYLQPEKYFQSILLGGGANIEVIRYQFVTFWTDLKDEQIEQMLAVMTSPSYKAVLLRMLARRKPSAEAYKRAMDALEVPAADSYFSDSLLTEIAEVGLKLHAYGALEPYRGKIQQFLNYWSAQKTKERAQMNIPANLQANLQRTAMMEPDAVLLCRALLNPEEFAASMSDQIQVDVLDLSPEDRVINSRNLSILMRLYPVEQLNSSIARMPTSDEFWSDVGTLNPVAALEAAKQDKITSEALRLVVQSALSTGHPDAQQVFSESLPIILRNDSFSLRVGFNTNRPAEIGWYRAASGATAEIRHVAAWVLAFDYLSGKYDELTSSVLPMMDRRTQNMLAVAYALVDEYPVLARQIADRAVPRLLQQVEADFDLPYSRSGDVSLAAYFEPQATTELLIKLQKRLDEEMKNQPAQVNSRMYGKRNSLTTLRAYCLRGLLIDQF